MILRPFYLARIQAYLDKPIIKVMTGMRRVGKSTLLAQVRESLLARGIPDAQILSINKDLVAWDGVRDCRDLDRIVQERLGGQPAPRYLMVDEIQEITGWEKAINSVLAQGLADILITGSNAHLLSTERATLLTGRFVEIPVYPLGFSEFMTFRQTAQDKGDRQDLFRLAIAGLGVGPVVAQHKDEAVQRAIQVGNGVGDGTGNRRSGSRQGARQERPAAGALPPFKISIRS